MTPASGAAAGSVEDRISLRVSEDERYGLADEIGRGGMGRVVEARDHRLRRQVAIKQLLRDDPLARARFLREAFLTARLQHPSIVPVLDAGRGEEGEPFYAMPLVSGPSLAEVIAETNTLADRLSLLPNVIAAVEAIAYAHSERVLHRDIKPHNIVIGPFGETFVVDWGLAKDLDAAEEDVMDGELPEAGSGSGVTVAGSVIGTPAFMPPEQARGDAVSERADVYSLGALLYNVLSGQPPYRANSSAEILAQLSDGPPVPVHEREPDTPSDLAAIVAKAMARDPLERYANASELVSDLRRFQTGQLVGAHRYTAWALFKRWLGRNRATVAVASGLLAALAVTAVLSVRNIIDARDEADSQRVIAQKNEQTAEKARKAAETSRHELLHRLSLSSLQTDPTVALAHAREYGAATKQWPKVRLLAAAAHNRGISRHVWIAHQGAQVRDVRFAADDTLLVTAGGDGKARAWDLKTGAGHVLVDHGIDITAFDVSPDGKRLASLDRKGVVRLTEVVGGSSRVLHRAGRQIDVVEFSPAGDVLAVAGGDDGKIAMISLEDEAVRVFEGHEWHVTDLAFSPDGATMASSAADNTVRTWRVETGRGKVMGRFGHSTFQVAYSDDGRFLATTCLDGTARVWNLTTNRPSTLRIGRRTEPLAFGRRSRLVIGGQATMARWDPTSGLETLDDDVGSKVLTLTYAPNRTTLAAGLVSGEIHVWDQQSGDHRVLRGHAGRISGLRFSGGGAWLASASQDGTARLWAMDQRDSKIILPRRQKRDGWQIPNVSYDGRFVAVTTSGTSLYVWERGKQGARLLADDVMRTTPWFTADSTRALIIGRDGSLRVFDLISKTARRLPGLTGDPRFCNASLCQVRASPSGELVAMTFNGPKVVLVDLKSGARRVLTGLKAPSRGLIFSRTGKYVAASSSAGELWIWEVATGKGRALKGLKPGPPRGLRFSRDDSTLLGRDIEGRITLWDTATGKGRLLDARAVGSHGFGDSADQRLVALGAAGGTVLIVEIATGKSRSIRAPGDPIRWLRFIEDDEYLMTASSSRDLRLWHVGTGQSVSLQGHKSPIGMIRSARDRELFSSADYGAIRQWTIRVPTDESALRGWLRRASSAVVNAQGRLATPMAHSTKSN